MPLVQFQNDYKRLMTRYKQELDKDTAKAFSVIDAIGKILAAKDISPDARDSQVNKLEAAMKKLKQAVMAEIAERLKANAAAAKKPPKGYDKQAADRLLNNVKRELLLLLKKAQTFTDTGGAELPPPKLPEFHFGTDYKDLITKYGGTLSPSVVSSLDKLDENNDAAKAVELIKLTSQNLKKQIDPLAAEASSTRDPKEKSQLTVLVKELNEFRTNLKNLAIRIFLIHRLKG